MVFDQAIRDKKDLVIYGFKKLKQYNIYLSGLNCVVFGFIKTNKGKIIYVKNIEI